VSPDRNLLFGILALQNNLVSRDQLVEAMNAWVLARHRPLGELLLDRGALGQEEHVLIEALIERQLARHQGDIYKSLQALELSPATCSLVAELPDNDLLAFLPSPATRPPEATVDYVHRPTGEGMRYRVLRPHARGGLGEVFVALDAELNREVALKEIQLHHADHPASRARFLLEAEMTGRLEHPGIVPVYGLGCWADGRPYYAMRFIQGDNLEHAIDRFHTSKEGFDSVAFRTLLGRFVDVCNAVGYANSRGVLHRDLKPGNVMLGQFGETLVVDWGLAKVVGRSDPTSGEATLLPSSSGSVAQTVAGSAIGTPAYMSPEQAEGKIDALGPATDVYSLGATLYCMLTGRAPLERGPVAVVLEKVRTGDIPPAREVHPGVPRALEATCRKAMSLRPGERYSSALALAADVERWLADEPVSAYHEPPTTRARRWARRHRTAVTSALAVLLVVLAGLSVGLVVVGGLNRRLADSNTNLELAREQAEKERNIAVAVNDFLRTDLLGQADVANQEVLAGKQERDPNITAAELLDRSARAIEGKFRDQPETEAALRLTIGEAYCGLGKYHLARPHLERSAALREKWLEPEHPDILASQFGLAWLDKAQGKYDLAEKRLVKVIHARERKLGADHLDTLTSRNYLAALYFAQGEYARAQTLSEELIQQQEKALGPDHPLTLGTRTNLATTYRAQAKYDKAEALYRSVARQWEQQRGTDHPNTLLSQNNLAILYLDQGKYDQAELLFQEVLRQTEKKRGPDHPDTLTSKQNLALLYQAQAKYDQAETLCLEVLGQNQKKLGTDHPLTLVSMNNLAYLYQAQGKYDHAEPLYLEVIGRQEKLGADHPYILTSKTNLAGLYQLQAKYDRAATLYRNVLGQLEKKLGGDHPDTLTCKNNLALLYYAQAKFDQAQPLFLEVLGKLEKKLSAGHPTTLTCKNNLARVHLALGQHDRAEALFIEVHRQFDKKLGSDHPSTLMSQSNLAGVYQDRKQYARAEALSQTILRVRRKKLGHDHPDTLLSLNNLGVLHHYQGKHASAERLYVESLHQQRKHKGIDHPDTLLAKSNLALLYQDQGKDEKAETLWEQAVQGSIKKLGPAHPTTRSMFNALVSLHERRGQYEKIEPLLRQRLDFLKATAGPESPAATGVMAELGGYLLRLKKHTQAENLLRDCLRIREKIQPDSWTTFNTRSLLGGALLGQKKYTDAEPLLIGGYEGLKQREAKIPQLYRGPRLKEALERLVQFYEATQNTEKAAGWRKKLDHATKTTGKDETKK
jgi:serine/threonine protein kinase